MNDIAGAWSPGRLLGGLGISEVFVFRPHSLSEKNFSIRTDQLDENMRNNGRAVIFRMTGDNDLAWIVFVAPDGRHHVLHYIDVDYTHEHIRFVFVLREEVTQRLSFVGVSEVHSWRLMNDFSERNVASFSS